jgi:hypothetical protein
MMTPMSHTPLKTDTAALLDLDYWCNLLGRPRGTVLKWVRLGVLPAPDVVVSAKSRYWTTETVSRWTKARGN